jgi:hypothetical protein
MEKNISKNKIININEINNSNKIVSNSSSNISNKSNNNTINQLPKFDFSEKNKIQPLLKKLTFFQEKSNKLEKPSVLNLKKNFFSSPINNFSSVTYSSNDLSGYEEKENEENEDEEYEDNEDEEFEDEEYEDEEYEDEEYEGEEDEEYEEEEEEEEDKGYLSEITHSYIDSEMSIITKSDISEMNEKSFSLINISKEVIPMEKKIMNNSIRKERLCPSIKSIKKNTIKNQKDKVLQIVPIKLAQNSNQESVEKTRINVSRRNSFKIDLIGTSKKRGFQIESKEKKRNFINNLIKKLEKNKNYDENKDQNKSIHKKNNDCNEKTEDQKSLRKNSDARENRNTLREVRRKISQKNHYGNFSIFN